MHLKTLEVQGYKSFANKVEFLFDDGITAIVGPNGSGKSNVADAIRWVLGEQGYSNLRGKKTEDMIFSGSDGRARLGMASATLVLDNSDRWLPLDFSEVTIARRAYRSGDNEYYLNGSRVRLKDINELLAKSGLSRQTYTVIGQGTIDRVLSLQAGERRKLFEEASGITFHRQKRVKTLDQLAETRDNLLRLNDIVKEIEPRLGRLEKQAQKANEYSQLMTHLDGLLRVWYGYRWGQSQRQLSDSKKFLHESEAVVKKQQAELAQLERDLSALRSEQVELRGKLGTRYAENKELQAEAEAVQRQLAVSEERASQYEAQRAEIVAELEALEANLTKQEQLVAGARTALANIERELQEAETVRQDVQQKLDVHQAERKNILARQAEAEKQVRDLSTRLTERQSRLTQAGERRDSLLTETQNRETELSGLTAEQADLEEKQSQLLAELATLDETLFTLKDQQSQERDDLTRLNEAADGLKAELAQLQRQEDSLKARQDVLDKLRTDMAGYYEGVKAVLQPQAKLSGIIGTVSQIMQVPPDLEVAIETTLGGRLQDVVVESFADAEAAVGYLKKTGRGRATFLPLDTIRVGRPADVPHTPGVVGLGSDLVRAEARLQPIIESILNRTIIADDLPAARHAFAEMQGGFQIVTREGELMRSGGSVTGGRDGKKRGRQGTFLTREREWRELPRQLKKIEQAQQQFIAQLDENRQAAQAIETRLKDLGAAQRQAEQRRAEVQGVADRVNRALTQLTDNIGWQQELQRKAQSELAHLEQRQQEIKAEIAELEQAQAEAEETAHRLAAEVSAHSAERLLADLSQAKSQVTLIQGRQKNQQSNLANHQATRQQAANQIESKSKRAETLAVERADLLKQQTDLRNQRDEFNRKLEKFTADIGQTEQRLRDLETRQAELEETEHGTRQHLHRLENEHNRISLQTARRQDDLEHLQQQIENDLGLVNFELADDQVGQPVLPLESLVSDLPVVEELPQGVEEDVKRLKIQVKRLGNINPEAPREYGELKERYDFLTGQMNDLEAAASDLKEIIARLDETMEESFTQTFQQVAVEFQRYFKALFGGGEAKLILTEPEDLIESGVDIVARPPGKRLQSLALLSGGERSLTAQALIFALLKISPTPFVIFDEVDAMLDEANVGRFREALAALAHEIQFIIITHNRKTIEAAQTIYGISMSEDSVSQAYSLKMEDWVENGNGKNGKNGTNGKNGRVNGHVNGVKQAA